MLACSALLILSYALRRSETDGASLMGAAAIFSTG